jgi:hypothetical protein
MKALAMVYLGCSAIGESGDAYSRDILINAFHLQFGQRPFARSIVSATACESTAETFSTFWTSNASRPTASKTRSFLQSRAEKEFVFQEPPGRAGLHRQGLSRQRRRQRGPPLAGTIQDIFAEILPGRHLSSQSVKCLFRRIFQTVMGLDLALSPFLQASSGRPSTVRSSRTRRSSH